MLDVPHQAFLSRLSFEDNKNREPTTSVFSMFVSSAASDGHMSVPRQSIPLPVYGAEQSAGDTFGGGFNNIRLGQQQHQQQQPPRSMPTTPDVDRYPPPSLHHRLLHGSRVECVTLDSPPPAPPLQQHRNSSARNQSNSAADAVPPPPPPLQQQTSSRARAPEPTYNAGGGASGELCPYCVVDSARVAADISQLQSAVARIAMRIETQDSETRSDRRAVAQCLAQVGEYSLGLGVVTKWVQAIGSALPRLARGLVGAAAAAGGGVDESSALMQPPPLAFSGINVSNVAGGTAAPRDGANNRGGDSASVTPSKQRQQQPQHSHDTSSILRGDDSMTTTMPFSEVRSMFASFRDEIVRLREKNEALELRLNDAVCRFEGSNISKLKAEVEGRLRTMLHSLHETMNGTASPMAALAQQVNSLRTEVEVLRSKTETAASSRGVLEARINDATTKLRDVSGTHSHAEQLVAAQQEEIRSLRAAMRELSTTFSHRLETERSAREFEAGDMRCKMRVIMRSPSPLARLTDPLTPNAIETR